MYQLRHYLNHCGKDMYADWLRRQRDSTARLAVIRRILRVATGNLGDHRFCRDGVWELRIDVGPGYRVYYALSGPPSDFIAVRWRQAYASTRYRASLPVLAGLEGEGT